MSRRFIAATAERLAEFRSRPLDDRRWLIVFVDGFDFAGHTMVGALGVTADGTKVPLGVVEGSTENASVVRQPRHLACATVAWTPARGSCSCSTAAKRCAKAVRDVFGDHAVIARCRAHKERNVLDHLPEAERPVGAPQAARRVGQPRTPARPRPPSRRSPASSSEVNPDAAASLREGLAETLTVTRLGVTGSLLKTVMSTNPVESMIEIVRAHAHNVKRWQRRRHAPAVGGRRHARRRQPVPSRQGLPPTPRSSPPRSATPSASPTRPPPPSQPDRMIHQEAATKFHGERVILQHRPRRRGRSHAAPARPWPGRRPPSGRPGRRRRAGRGSSRIVEVADVQRRVAEDRCRRPRIADRGTRGETGSGQLAHHVAADVAG